MRSWADISNSYFFSSNASSNQSSKLPFLSIGHAAPLKGSVLELAE